MSLVALTKVFLSKFNGSGDQVPATVVVEEAPVIEPPGVRDCYGSSCTHSVGPEQYQIGKFHLQMLQAQREREQQRRLAGNALTELMLANQRAMRFVEMNPDLRYVEGTLVEEERLAFPAHGGAALGGPTQGTDRLGHDHQTLAMNKE